MSIENEKLNIHQKLLKIAHMAGVLRKNKSGYNYKYVTEDEIQAKITAGMQKYGVFLYPSITPNTLQVTPYHYEKVKQKKTKDTLTGKDTLVDYNAPVNEVIVSCEVKYTWVNVDYPEDKIECGWVYVGKMEDASQAFGAGATYGNRYYLLKALQLATVEDDPDNYRSKQKQAEEFEQNELKKEIEKELKKNINNVTEKGKHLIAIGFVNRQELTQIVAKHNNGEGSPNLIKSSEIAMKILEEMIKIEELKNKKEGN